MRQLVLIAMTVAVSACGPSPQQQAEDARARAGSWAATVTTVIDVWADGIVPARYVTNTIDAATTDVTAESSRLQSDVGPSAAAPLLVVRDALPKIAASVAQGNRDAARSAAHALRGRVTPQATPPVARPGSAPAVAAAGSR